jgi:hypothetical protein
MFSRLAAKSGQPAFPALVGDRLVPPQPGISAWIAKNQLDCTNRITEGIVTRKAG